MLWPRRSWSRSAKYVTKRILRLTGSPHAVSAGVAAGVFASFTPFLGLHFIIAFAVAYLIAGNFLAAAMGTFFGNPISFPFIWTSTYKIGNFILTGEWNGAVGEGLSELAEIDIAEVGFTGFFNILEGLWHPLIKPMSIGAVPLGVAFGIGFYIATRWATGAFRRARARRLARKANKIKAA